MLSKILFLAFLGVRLMEHFHNIDEHERLHYTNLNIPILLMESTRDFKFRLMIHHNPFKRLSMEKPGKFEKKWQSQFPRISLFLFKTIDFPSETNTMKSKIQYLLCQ